MRENICLLGLEPEREAVLDFDALFEKIEMSLPVINDLFQVPTFTTAPPTFLTVISCS